MDQRDRAREPESIYTAVTRWAGHAPPPVLRILTVAGLLGAGSVVLLDWRWWPLAGSALAVSAIGLWGLVDQRAPRPLTRGVTIAEQLLTIFGLVVGGVAAIGVLLLALGDAPNH